MIIAFPEPRAPKEKGQPSFFHSLGSRETVYTVVISKNYFAYETLRQSLISVKNKGFVIISAPSG